MYVEKHFKKTVFDVILIQKSQYFLLFIQLKIVDIIFKKITTYFHYFRWKNNFFTIFVTFYSINLSDN